MKTYAFSILALCWLASVCGAAVVTVGGFGNQGWYSDDTRKSGGTNLIGINYTHAPGPSPTPSAADDAAIASKLVFDGSAPAGFNGTGALKYVKEGNYDKATLSAINTGTGFASSSGGNSWAAALSGSYRYYTNYTNEAPQMKLGVRSASWSASQSGFTASRSGESSWDLILVVNLDTPTANAWTTYTIDSNTKWRVFRQSGNSYFSSPGGYGEGGTPNEFGQTIAAWAADSYWGPKLFGDGALVSNVQFGVGSSTGVGNSWLDSFSLSIYNGGDLVNFVPEPATVGLLALGTIALIRGRRNA